MAQKNENNKKALYSLACRDTQVIFLPFKSLAILPCSKNRNTNYGCKN